ncbi:MAG: metallophosphatase domain-containing protein [Melioribacteraceae bacterium]|nr:metallophosphatase domain-containing protein [Melioribacteraceae bacterium]
MKKITFISDTHGIHKDIESQLDGGFMIIHAGDVTSMGHTKEIRGFLKWFGSLPYQYKVFIAGNHDFGLQNYPLEHFNIPSGVFYLQDSMIEIDGLKIYGSPYCPTFGRWAFMKNRGKEIAEVWSKIPEGIDILVTHGPPMDILDMNLYEVNCGCKDLLARVETIKPKIHVFGHIHENHGSMHSSSRGITFINASNLNEDYQCVNKPIYRSYEDCKKI